jgi:HlyD family secretion protein
MRLELARRLLGLAALAVAIGYSSIQVSRARTRASRSLDALYCATVQKSDINVTVLATGVTQCSNQLTVRCELESLGTGGGGGGSASTILSLAPEGAHVKEGDILVELDASNYEDLLRTQEIKVLQARAEKQQAELDLEIAQIAALEFEEGLNRQTEKAFLGQIALLRSDLQRAADHLNWSIRMQAKGYISAAQIATERTTLQRCKLNLELAEMSLENYRRFSFPKQTRGFQSQIAGARSTVDFQTIRLAREEERLALYQRQVERCTIRAPHDGMVVYANEPGRTPQVFVEAPVRQRQQLINLPDLSEMEVGLFLHESVVSRVEVGMRAQIRVEAFPEQVLEGHVTAISRLPMFDRNRESSNEVKMYQGRVQLDSIPDGLLPGMTAQVVLSTDELADALLIPTEAVASEEQQEYCYVVRGDHLERQPVEVNEATYGLLEVTEGLEEGDRVVLNPHLQQLPQDSVVPK